MNLYDVNNIKSLLKKYNFKFSKSLGQNFLINRDICLEIVRQSNISKNMGVIEVGPGIGNLTAEIAMVAKKVVAVEIDKKLLTLLNETLDGYDNIKIINDDILKINLHKLIKQEFENLDVIVCANLPYYITSPVIMKFLESGLPIKSMTVMVQKEAAQRLVALPGSKNVGSISITVRYHSEPSILFDVFRESFIPKPDVDSSVIKFDIRSKPPIETMSEVVFFKVVRAAFSQRRKTIANSLANVLNLDKSLVKNLLYNLKIDENKRAENLSLEDFSHIADEIYNIDNYWEGKLLC